MWYNADKIDGTKYSISGSASNNGVNFVSDNYSVKFTMDTLGNYEITHKELPYIGSFGYWLSTIPVLKGLFALFGINPAISISAISLVAVDISNALAKNSSTTTSSNILLIVLTLVALFLFAILGYTIKTHIFNIKNTWMFHGAEHKIIYTYKNGLNLTLENVRASPRISGRCGTNLAVFFVLFFAILCFITDFQSIRFIGAFIIAYELFDLENGEKYPIIKVFFRFGHWCQEKLFTKEPSDIQIIASIDAINRLIELENGLEEEDI